MSRIALHDLTPAFQAQAIAQLHGTPKPRTVRIEPAQEMAATKPKRAHGPDRAHVIAFFAAQGIPAPEAEHKFAPDRRWRFDYSWTAHKVALEVEGGVWTGGRHTRGSGFLGDMEKYNRAAVLGWRVARVVPSELMKTATVELIRQMIWRAA